MTFQRPQLWSSGSCAPSSAFISMSFGHTVRGFPCPWSSGRPRGSWLPRSADSMCSEFPALACALALTSFRPWLTCHLLRETVPGRPIPVVPPSPALSVPRPALFSSVPLLPTWYTVLCCPSLLSRLNCVLAGWFHVVHGYTSPAPRAVPGTRLSASGVWVSPSHAPRRKITPMCPGRFLLPNPALASPVHRL